MNTIHKPSVMLLDIEGTTTPISFVYDTLFPYARAHLLQHLECANEQELLRDLDQLYKENQAEKSRGAPMISEGRSSSQAYTYLVWLMNEDRKSPALKAIQGKIWETGYRSGQLKSTIFPDVPRALERWHGQGCRIAIYSSGSVLAQKLLFRYSDCGDLTQWIQAYFDTGTGAKIEAMSYRKIAKKLAVDPQEMLFLSDSLAELNAAEEAGLDVCLTNRPGNRPISASVRHLHVCSFDEL